MTNELALYLIFTAMGIMNGVPVNYFKNLGDPVTDGNLRNLKKDLVDRKSLKVVNAND